jgi:hypothetical protein
MVTVAALPRHVCVVAVLLEGGQALDLLCAVFFVAPSVVVAEVWHGHLHPVFDWQCSASSVDDDAIATTGDGGELGADRSRDAVAYADN